MGESFAESPQTSQWRISIVNGIVNL